MRSRYLLATAALLAGCAGERAAPPAPPADTAAAPAPAAPPVAAAPAPRPVDPSRLLSERGIGALRYGMTAAEAQAALNGELNVEEPISGDGDDACRYGRSPRVPGFVMLEGARVVRVDGDSTTVTAAGARIGMSEAEVLTLYPGARVMPHHYTDGHYLVVLPGAPADTTHRLVFETDGKVVTGMRGGVYPPVEYVEGCA